MEDLGLIPDQVDIRRPCVIGPDVVIGAGSIIWEYAKVIRGAMLREGCTVGGCAIVDGAKVGKDCLISHGAQLHPGLVAGDNVFFGPGCIVCNDPWPRVNKGDFDKSRFADGFVSVRIGANVSIGAGAIVLPGVTIGECAMIAAGAVVVRDVAPGKLFKRCGHTVTIDRRSISRMRAA